MENYTPEELERFRKYERERLKKYYHENLAEKVRCDICYATVSKGHLARHQSTNKCCTPEVRLKRYNEQRDKRREYRRALRERKKEEETRTNT